MVGVSSVLIIDDAAQLLGDAANSYKLARRQVMTLLRPLMRKMLQLAKFTDVVNEFDSMTPLDTWKTTLLLRMKERLKAKELEEDDLT